MTADEARTALSARPRPDTHHTDYTGQDLMSEVLDLIEHRLPRFPAGDPFRDVFAGFHRELAVRLGRPALREADA